MTTAYARVVLASGNRGKLAELRALIGPRFELLTQAEFAVPEVDESGRSFIENAILKARNASGHTGLPSLADDSGLAVDFLGGLPGIRSARYAGPGASDEDNNRLLLQALAGVPESDRGARFHCVAVFMRSAEDPAPLVCHATWEGRILEAPRGRNGFGYDPLFYLADRSCTAAELDPEEKNRISHRGRAFRQLLAQLP